MGAYELWNQMRGLMDDKHVLESFNHTTHLSNEPWNYSNNTLVVHFNQVVFAVIYTVVSIHVVGLIKNLI